MRRIWTNLIIERGAVICAVICATVLVAMADGDAVEPQSLDGVELHRGGTEIVATTNTVFTREATILFTNITCYATADLGTNSVLQGLSNVTVEVAMSTSSTSTGVWETASVQVASNGTWQATYTMPDANPVYWQVRLTDASTNIYYYTVQKLDTQSHL